MKDNFDEQTYKRLGAYLRRIRQQQNLTLQDVAQKTDVSFKTLQRYETGESKIKMRTLALLCKLYQYDLTTLLSDLQLLEKEADSRETELIETFRSLSPEKQSLLLDLAKTLK